MKAAEFLFFRQEVGFLVHVKNGMIFFVRELMFVSSQPYSGENRWPEAGSMASAFIDLLLDPHEIFILRTLVRVYPFQGNPLPFPWVKPGRAR